MNRPIVQASLATALAALVAQGAARAGGPLQFVDETDQRLIADAALGAADTALKRYAWGDLDQDGDVDLVVVRTSAPVTSFVPLPNVLFINEGVILVDRTAEYASASTLPGDQGFLTPTSDTHVAMIDVDGDGRLDVVTATASADGLPKAMSHPRVYWNLGSLEGAWLGLRYEPERIPEMHATAGPRFEDLAAGDLTGDGRPELYFVDDDLGPESFDYGDRLLVNDGNGFFADETAARLPTVFTGSGQGGDASIGDINGDLAPDIVRLRHVGASGDLDIAYNDPADPGVFAVHEVSIPLGYSPFNFNMDELNGDGLLDLVVLENDVSPYMVSAGVDESGHATFETHYFGDNLSYGRPILADVDGDGAPDCLKAQMYSYGNPTCSLPMEVFLNTGIADDLFEEVGTGLAPALLAGTRDVAVFDLDGDGWTELILARCTGHVVMMNHHPDVAFDYAPPIPLWAAPSLLPDVEVDLTVLAPGGPQPVAVRLHASVSGGAWTQTTMEQTAGLHFRAALPQAGCGDVIEYSLTVDLGMGRAASDPPAGAEPYRVALANEAVLIHEDALEGDVSGWTVGEIDLEAGAWMHAAPIGTVFQGAQAAPAQDATPGPGSMCFVTMNGAGYPWEFDVDGGPAYLITPPLAIDAPQAIVRFQRWMFSEWSDPATHLADELTVEVSGDDGETWTAVPHLATAGSGSAWETASFLVGPYVQLPGAIRLRFGVADNPDNSICEAAIDELEVEALSCAPPPCPSDLDVNGATGITDLLVLLQSWGAAGSPADIDRDGTVGIADFLALLSSWGPCPFFVDCNANGAYDSLDLQGGASADCNGNDVPDECDAADGTSPDLSGNGIPDECEPAFNDACQDAIAITDGSTLFATTTATTDGPLVVCGVGGGLISFANDIWFAYTPSCTGNATFSLCNSADFDTLLAVYFACPEPMAFYPVACSDSASDCGATSEIHLLVAAGVPYLVRVGSPQGAGMGVLTIACAPGP